MLLRKFAAEDLIVLIVVMGKRAGDLDFVVVNVLLHRETFHDIEILEVAVLVADHALRLAFAEHIHSHAAHNGSIHAVLRGGAAAPLHVAEDRGAGVDARRCLDPARHGRGVADALGVHDNVVRFASPAVLDDVVDDLLLVVIVLLRKQDILRAVGDAAPQSDIARVPAHDLDDAASLMGGRGIADLVDGLHSGIDGRIKADRVLGAGNIQIDSPGHADHVDAVVRQRLGAAEGTVAADDHQAFDSVLQTVFRCPADALFCAHLLAAGRIENGAALLDCIGHIMRLHILDLLVDQALIALHDPLYLKAFCKSPPYNGADRCVHARRIAAAG